MKSDDVTAVFEHSSCKPLKHCPRNWHMKMEYKIIYVYIITVLMAAQNHISTLFVLCLVSVWYDIFDPMLTFLEAGFWVGSCAHKITDTGSKKNHIWMKKSRVNIQHEFLCMIVCMYIHTYIKNKNKEREIKITAICEP
jgi:hypothetical protein